MHLPECTAGYYQEQQQDGAQAGEQGSLLHSVPQRGATVVVDIFIVLLGTRCWYFIVAFFYRFTGWPLLVPTEKYEGGAPPAFSGAVASEVSDIGA